ncbi:MAG: glycerophosphodiester phosphodiesterase [Burkholderiaceae bacterium]|nr:glycerophosphodiester phosphodiesterase [Burkholderiaceae bacterium]
MWNFPRVLAHRGGGTLAPENTLAALRCGNAHGFRAVEFDVMMIGDGTLVLMHDNELGRTVQGEGSLAGCTLGQLAAADAGSWFSEAFAGEPVPTFAQAADFCLRHGIAMNAEIKPVPGTEAATGQAVAAACTNLPPGSVLLSSFSVEALVAAREAAPGVPRGLLVGAVPDDWREQMRQAGALALHARAGLLTAGQAAAVKAAGFGLMVYTVNQPAEARALFAIGVDAVCTDRIDVIGADFR